MYELSATKIIRPCNFIGQHTDSNSDKPNLNGKNFRNGRQMTIVQWNCDNRVTHWFLIQTSRFYFYIESNRQFNNLQFLSSFNCWNSSVFSQFLWWHDQQLTYNPILLDTFQCHRECVFKPTTSFHIDWKRPHKNVLLIFTPQPFFSVFVTRTNRNDLFAIYGRRRAI